MKAMVEATEGRLELDDVAKYFELRREQERAIPKGVNRDAVKGEPYNMTCMYFSADDPPEILRKEFEAYGRKAIDMAKSELEAEGKIERFCVSANARPQWGIRLKEGYHG